MCKGNILLADEIHHTRHGFRGSGWPKGYEAALEKRHPPTVL